MQMTYRQLRNILNSDLLTDEQLDCDITVEDTITEECYPADFRICDKNHFALDDNHPVIYICNADEDFPMTDDDIDFYIQSIKDQKC